MKSTVGGGALNVQHTVTFGGNYIYLMHAHEEALLCCLTNQHLGQLTVAETLFQ